MLLVDLKGRVPSLFNFTTEEHAADAVPTNTPTCMSTALRFF